MHNKRMYARLTRGVSTRERRLVLFADRNRTYAGPRSHAELEFDYLERSARPAAGRVREFLEKWFSAFPNEHRSEMEARLRIATIASSSRLLSN